jgi:hypothetical protein
MQAVELNICKFTFFLHFSIHNMFKSCNLWISSMYDLLNSCFLILYWGHTKSPMDRIPPHIPWAIRLVPLARTSLYSPPVIYIFFFFTTLVSAIHVINSVIDKRFRLVQIGWRMGLQQRSLKRRQPWNFLTWPQCTLWPFHLDQIVYI